MKFFKYPIIIIIILLFLVFIGYSAAWYYVVTNMTHHINSEYANKKHRVFGHSENRYYVMFREARASGFPFSISFKLDGLEEEGGGGHIIYYDPVIIGYNFITGDIHISYDGNAKALFKPASLGFGAKYKINDYSLRANLPFTLKLLRSIRNMKDGFELINYINDVTLSTDQVSIFDLVDDYKLYDKEYEQFTLSFNPVKYYTSKEDFVNNIPKEYDFTYKVKTQESHNYEFRKIPQSLLYVFITLPSSFSARGKGHVTTKANNFKELQKDINIIADFEAKSPSLELQDFKFQYQGSASHAAPHFKSQINTVLFVKKGFVDKLFAYYDRFKYLLNKSDSGKILASEIDYVRNNRELFKLHELENVKYDFNVDYLLKHAGNTTTLKFNNLSLFGEETGFKVTSNYEIKKRKTDNIWNLNGELYLRNYVNIIEFTSPYIYRFGKFRGISDIARDLYVDLNKQFLRKISDYPDSKSNDLSLSFDIHSNYLDKAKIGAMNIMAIKELYLTMLYQKVLAATGLKGDVLEHMKEFIPDIDKDKDFINNILPQIERLKNKTNSKDASTQTDDIVPDSAVEVLKEVLPKKHKQKLEKHLKQDVLKQLLK